MMIVSNYPNERALVNDFVTYTFSHPLPLSSGEERRLFIWGYEVWLPEGKSNTKSGSIDLIGTDDHGNVWLIEAKLCTNRELNHHIWSRQIDPYRISLSKREEYQIAMSARRFLLGNSAEAVKSPYLIHTKGLFHAFEQWCEHWRIPVLRAKELYDKTMENIQSGRIISTVLADVADESVWQSRYSSFEQGGFSYIVFDSSDIYVEIDLHSDSISIGDRDFSRDTWVEFLKKKREIKPTPSTVELYLADEVVNTYHKIIEALVKLGWDHRASSNTKAVAFNLPTKYGVDIRIHIGWVDADGSLDIKYRKPYSYGLKFNIDFRYFKAIHELKEIWYPLAKRLVNEARYNGRGDAEVLSRRDLYDHEYNSWDGEMYRMVNKYNRDYIGREEETEDLDGALSLLKEIVVKGSKAHQKTRESQKANDWEGLSFF